MKNLSKIKLNQLSKVELEKREQQKLLGGGSCCGCGCNGPSSTWDNAVANWNNKLPDSEGGEKMCACWGDDQWTTGW